MEIDGTTDPEGQLSADVGFDCDITGTIYLVRHGRTGLNATGRLRGLLDPDLDEVGRHEAHALGRAIAPLEPTWVVTSPLRRARQTATAIAERCHVDHIISMDLQDRDYGAWTGAATDDVVAEWGSVDAAPGVESRSAILERALRAIDSATAGLGPKPVVLVAHDAINRTLLAALDPWRWPSIDDIPQPTGCLNVLVRVGDNWRPVSVGVAPGPSWAASV